MNQQTPSNTNSSSSDTSTSRLGETGSGRRWLVLSLLAVLLVGGGTGGYVALNGEEKAVSDFPTATVRRGALDVTISESGEVEAGKRKTIRNELEWSALIETIVDNGTVVEPNQLILEFECDELDKALSQRELEVSNAENEYVRAEKNLELKREEVDRQVVKAEQAINDAEKALARYKEAVWPIELSQAGNEVTLAERDLAVAKDQLELKLRVNQDEVLEGLYSEKVIQSYEFEVEKQTEAAEQARSQLEMLKKYDHPKKIRELETAIQDAKLDYKRAQLEARNEIDKAEAELRAKKLTLDRQNEELAELREDREKLEVRAEEEGLVVYDTGRRHWQQELTIAAGEKIDSKQQLMIIPDLGTLQIKTKVFEAMIEQVQEGGEAIIRLDSSPDVAHRGTVHWIAPLADAAHRWLNPGVKVFEVVVRFDEIPEGLKPNMTADVEIKVARLDDVLTVPIAAVFTEAEEAYCWRVGPQGPAKAPIKVGRSNERRVQVLEGLSAGDEVLLVAPTDGDTEQSPEAAPMTGGREDSEA
ncbi:MAG: efflux RND transporter periplasmic adaptor subunit [Planctomycetota bacterium]